MESDTRSRYDFVRLLGQGAFGVVFEGRDRRSSTGVAIKRIPLPSESSLDIKRTLRELKLLRTLRHPNITALLDVVGPSSLSSVYLVLELMDTDLCRVLARHQRLSTDHIRHFTYQLLKALKFLHSGNVVHRDLKPSNRFVNSDGTLKVGDFGFARIVGDPRDPDLQSETILTRWYRAPEVLLNMSNYGAGIDVWSAGCIVAEMLLGRPLLPGQSNVNMLTLIVELLGSPSLDDVRQVTNASARTFLDSLPRCVKKDFRKVFEGCDTQAIDLVESMLTWNPETRVSVEEALGHLFVSGLHDSFGEPVTVPLRDFDFERAGADEIRELIGREVMAWQRR
jgi:mitogen-activated protein kinase 1/3